MRNLPPGFDFVGEGRLRVVVRRDVRDALLPLLRQWASEMLPPPRPLAGGRGAAGVYHLGAELAVVLRPYRRGGLVRRFVRDAFCGVRPRPVRELLVTEELRRRGVPTLEVLAAAAYWLAPGCYRGALVSRELPLAVNLWQYLREVDRAERARVCADAAQATRRLHDAGAVHPDLNLQNYLVRRGPAGREVLIIDFDRVRLGPVSARQRQAAFKRICRSIRRLDPTSEIITLGCVEALHHIADPDGS